RVATEHSATQFQQLSAEVAASTARADEWRQKRQELTEEGSTRQEARRQLALACQKIEHALEVATIEWEAARDALQGAELAVARLAEQREMLRGAALAAQQQQHAEQRKAQLRGEIDQLRERIAEIEGQQQ